MTSCSRVSRCSAPMLHPLTRSPAGIGVSGATHTKTPTSRSGDLACRRELPSNRSRSRLSQESSPAQLDASRCVTTISTIDSLIVGLGCQACSSSDTLEIWESVERSFELPRNERARSARRNSGCTPVRLARSISDAVGRSHIGRQASGTTPSCSAYLRRRVDPQTAEPDALPVVSG